MLSRMNGSFGDELVRALDQLEALLDARRAVDQRVAERVHRLRVVRLQLDQPRQALDASSTRSIFSATIAAS